MAGLWGGDTVEGPICRVYAIFSIEDPVIDVEMIIISIEEDFNRLVLMAGDKIEMRSSC
jgi:hypothetical protein